MRVWAGIGVLVLGVVGLSAWARTAQAPWIEAQVAQRTALALAAVPGLSDVAATVSGRDIRLSGVVETEALRAAAIAAADAVTGRRVVVAEIDVPPRPDPWLTVLDRPEGATVPALSGHGPAPAVQAPVLVALGLAESLPRAGDPPPDWRDQVRAGVAALAPLVAGRAEIGRDGLVLTGTALGPAARDRALDALAALPVGRTRAEIALLDDGTPAVHRLDWSATDGGRLSGKLPRGLTVADVQTALGLTRLSADVDFGLLDPPEAGAAAAARWARLRPFLPRLETLAATDGPDGVALSAGVAPGTDPAAVAAALAAALGPQAAIQVETVRPDLPDGTERRHDATGAAEVLGAGYWLPVPAFTPTPEACTAAAAEVLAGETINFASASAELDDTAIGLLNRLGGILRHCTLTGGLFAEVGGHTDASGNPESNRRLSQRRASAVRLALIARGAVRERIVSRGYGDTVPVADNATPEGRALNRRTTIAFVDPPG